MTVYYCQQNILKLQPAFVGFRKELHKSCWVEKFGLVEELEQMGSRLVEFAHHFCNG